MLAVDVSRGYNVPQSPVGEIDDSFEAPRSAKRQKLLHQVSISSTSSESLDAGDVTLKVTQYGKSPTTSSRTQNIASRSGTRTRIGAADEYRGVEGMMDSNPRNAKRHNAHRLRKASAPLVEDFSRNSSVDTVGEAEHTAAATTATVDSSREISRDIRPELTHRNGTMKSDYKAPMKQTHSQYFQPKSRQSMLPTHINQNLRTQFISTEGRPRGSMDHLSSDELDGPPTLGEHADVIPLSPQRRRQPVSSKGSVAVVRSASSSTEEQPVERSNIKPTIFSSQARSKGKSNRQADFENEYLDEEKPSWAIPLAAVNLPGQELRRSSHMKLVYDKSRNRYFVEEDGDPLEASGSLLEVCLRKLQRCWYDESGKRVRFESSKRGISDHILDLELCSIKDIVELMLRIQNKSTNVKIITEDRYVDPFLDQRHLMLTRHSSEKMQRRFENRRKQPQSTPPIERFDEMPEDVQLIAKNQQRQEIRGLEKHETSNTGRRRKKLANGMTHTVNSDKGPIGFKPNSALRAKPSGLPGRTTAGSNSKVLDRPSIFENLRPAHNDHLRRSTRTSGVLARYPGELEEFEDSKIEKYSVKFGLGDRWSKPLSYPKVGKKKATVEWEDLERLDEGEFLNDNLVSFYMRYLEQDFTDKSPELAKTVYFFNSFFYDRLTTTKKGQKGINYEGVQRWTRGVNLFAYDYVVVPINELAHWYVAIICNLPALDRSVGSSDQPLSPEAATNDQLAQGFRDSVVEEDVLEPREKQARQSFAELSLESKPHKRQLSDDSLIGEPNLMAEEVAAAVEEDHGMLDVPDITNNEADVTTSTNIEGEAHAINDPDGAPRPGILTKKQKRKSILPSITKRDPSDPTVITFDSFGHPHSHVIKVLKQYLYEEGKAKRNIEFNVSNVRGITAKNIPQQRNFSDCGLYMLGYVEKFLEDHPRDFIAKIIKREYDDRTDWPRMVPSNMRRSLREQLQSLHEEDQAERLESAIISKEYPARSRNAEGGSPSRKEQMPAEKLASKAEFNRSGEASPHSEKSDAQDPTPLNVQSIRNATYYPNSGLEEDSAQPLPESKGTANDSDVIHKASPDRSLVVVESQTQPEVMSKDPTPNVPSSQPSQPPNPGNTKSRSSPVLPNEIKDSQPSQLQIAELKPHPSNNSGCPPKEIKAAEGLKHSPNLPSQKPTPEKQITGLQMEQQPGNLDKVNNNRKATDEGQNEGEARDAPPLPPRSRRKGTAQRVQPLLQRHQQLQRGKKMTKDEAIVLDDD